VNERAQKDKRAFEPKKNQSEWVLLSKIN
jgi:hypothetical protein